MTATDKRSLISESVTAIRIDIHHAGKEHDRHIVHMTPEFSRTTTVREVSIKLNQAPTPRMKSCPLMIVWLDRHLGLPHSPSNKPPQSREV
jgi:hypothetical protein